MLRALCKKWDPLMKSRAQVWTCIALLWCSNAAADQSDLAAADAFLQRNNASRAREQLSAAEKTSLARTLRMPGRTVDDHVIARLVTNPVAWRPGPEGREMLRSIISSLPHVANIPGAGCSLENACNPDPSNFRGFGFETIATAALTRYREPDGAVPRMVRMSGQVRGRNGHYVESDGCAVFSGADSRQRLVTMKSVRSERALHRAVHKATFQLSQRNGSRETPGQLGQRGILMLGYSDPHVLEAAQRKDWQAAARRSGAKLLVLAVDQLNGQVTRLASETPPPFTQRDLQQGRDRHRHHRHHRSSRYPRVHRQKSATRW
jgi:hypothetical protein